MARTTKRKPRTSKAARARTPAGSNGAVKRARRTPQERAADLRARAEAIEARANQPERTPEIGRLFGALSSVRTARNRVAEAGWGQEMLGPIDQAEAALCAAVEAAGYAVPRARGRAAAE